MPAPPNEVFSAFAFLGFVLCMIPLPWHLEAWNTGTCLYMIWTGLGCLNQFINSIVWNGNAINWAPVWCDISSRYMVGQTVAIPAASLCITRRLYHISAATTVTTTKAEKRRAIMVDLAIGLGIPVLQMVLQYIPQGHRFNIWEDIGCYSFTYNTPVGFALVGAWPVAIGLVSGVYAVLSIIAFNKRRTQFNELLSTNSNLTSSRYIRLMCLAGVDILLTVPLASYAIYLNASNGRVSPWISWADTHYGFSRVDSIPAIIWRSNPTRELTMELSRWFLPMCALVFFAFFGFADEAMKHYRSAVSTVAKRVGISTGSMKSELLGSTVTRSRGMTSSGRASIPAFGKRTARMRDSFESFTDMSASYNGDAEKEKSFNGVLSCGQLSLNDVGGTLQAYKEDKYSPSSSSGSSASISSPTDTLSPSLPERAALDANDMASARLSTTSVRFPEPVVTRPARGNDGNV